MYARVAMLFPDCVAQQPKIVKIVDHSLWSMVYGLPVWSMVLWTINHGAPRTLSHIFWNR